MENIHTFEKNNFILAYLQQANQVFKVDNLKLAQLYHWVFILMFTITLQAQVVVNTTTSGIAIPYQNLTGATITIKAEIWGPGGGGGGSNSNNNGGSGGGGGAYVLKTFTLANGAFINYDIGAGGAAGSSAAGTGGTTTATTLTATDANGLAISLSAGAGTGGAGNKGAAGTGGVATGGDTNTNGSNGTVGTALGQAGGASPNGGSATGTVSGAVGASGNLPGGGGGGGERGGGNRAGGPGANGKCLITIIATEINIQGNATSIADGSVLPSITNHTDFVGNVTRTYTIQNTGTATLTVGAISFSGTDASSFSVTTPPAASVVAGGSTTFVVTCNAATTGLKTATISIANNDTDEAIYDFAIQATPSALISITGLDNTTSAVTAITAAAAATTTNGTNFGSVDLNTGAVLHTFTINNTGSLNLSISSLVLGGTTPGDFKIMEANGLSSPSYPFTIAGGGSATFILKFNPSSAKVRNATLTIASSDTSTPSFLINLQGTGTNQEINIQGNGVSIPGDAAGFASVSVANFTDFGSTNTTRTFTIQNLGTSALTLGAISFTGANPGDFSVTTAPTSPIQAGASTTFTVTFAPSTTGVKTANINILNNDTTDDIAANGTSQPEGNILTSGAYIFKLQATAVASTMTVTGINSGTGASGNIVSGSAVGATTTTNGTDFGTAALTGPAYTFRTYTISNIIAGVPITLGAFTFDTPAGSGSVVGTTFTITSAVSTITVNGGQSVTFTVRYNPTGGTSGTAQTQRLVINYSNPGASTYTFFLKGTPTNSVNTRLMSFQTLGGAVSVANGDVTSTQAKGTDVGNTSIDSGSITVNYLMKNTGTGTLNIGSIYLTTVGSATISTEFAVVSNVNISQALSLGAGATRPLQISFNPTTIGVKTATLHIISDDSSGATDYQVQLQGTGFKALPDTDGDGVYNDTDVDDDNDGILDTSEQTDCLSSPFAKTVSYTYLNEDFGNGISRGQINVNTPLATTVYCYEDGIVGSKTPNTTVGASDYCKVSLTDDTSGTLDDGEYAVYAWVGSDNISGVGYYNAASAYYDTHSDSNAWRGSIQDHTAGDTNGRMAIFNADTTPGGVFYNFSIAGVIPNSPITLTFSVVNILSKNNYSGTYLPVLQANFYDLSDNLIAGTTLTTPNIGRCDDTTDNGAAPAKGSAAGNTCADPSVWLTYSKTVNLGAITGFKIKIANNCTGGGGNDLAIDDIIIKQDYCDLENDGVVCIYDLDSDDDGIPDAEENGFGTKLNGKSYLPTGYSGYADSNGNGWRDDVENDYVNETTVITAYIDDVDGDGVKNYLDHDSDNDGVFDTAEGSSVTDANDVDDDGVVDGTESGDTDGIVGTPSTGFTNTCDNLVGYGTTTFTAIKNTDGADLPDYLDLDSDNDGVYDIADSIYSDLDADADGMIDDLTDPDKEGIVGSRDSDSTIIGSPRDISKTCRLYFDGSNDYAEDTTFSFAGRSAFTVMAWVDLSFGGTQTLLGQNNFLMTYSGTRKLSVSITTGTGTSSFNGSIAYTSNQWAHVAVVYDGANLKMYYNGTNTVSNPKTGAISADASTFTIGKTPGVYGAGKNYLKGYIDEVRIFDMALTDTQIQRMMNQQITNNGGQVRGDIIPYDIGGVPYANLLKYYKFDNYKDDISDDATTVAIDTGSGLKIYNHKTIKLQNAPLPFVTTQTGDFATAVTDVSNDINGADIHNYAYAIVQAKHDIVEPNNVSMTGLIVDSGKNITVSNDNQIQNNWYLKLDGKIDLVGKSQLVQTTNSILEATSAGSIERDQQGQLCMYDYNYWCSPVGPINIATNNNNYTIDGVLRDGSDPNNLQSITWVASNDVTSTSPISLSTKWLYKFQNTSSAYANWSKIDQTSSLSAGQGFTMKGNSPTVGAGTQNYTFVGKPNNGAITLPIAAVSSNLTGNPYPSALDADAFIMTNITGGATPSITGSLYFWEQYSTNPSHVLANYQGGYGVYTLVGGTAPVSPTGVSGLGTSTHGAPKRYIPVGQAFFVNADADGGTITFDNSMRAFIKEDHASSSYMFRKNLLASSERVVEPNNQDDLVVPDTHEKIKIGFNSHDNYHRELLIGFMDDKATSGIDPGYDAVHIDNQPNDMYFLNNGLKLNIQGEGYFNEDASYLLGVKTDAQGLVSFVYVKGENSPTTREVYIFDNLTGESHNIKNGKFEITIDQGVFEDRFFLRFKKEAPLGLDKAVLNEKLTFSFSSNNNTINLSSSDTSIEIQKATLISILGQEIMSWNTSLMNQSGIELPVRNVSTGTYLVKITTSKGDFTKKIIIEN